MKNNLENGYIYCEIDIILCIKIKYYFRYNISIDKLWEFVYNYIKEGYIER